MVSRIFPTQTHTAGIYSRREVRIIEGTMVGSEGLYQAKTSQGRVLILPEMVGKLPSLI